MMRLTPGEKPESRLGLRFDREVRFASAPPDWQNFLAAALHTHRPLGPVSRSVPVPMLARPRTSMPWLSDAFAVVDRIDQEAEEEGYPPIRDIAKRNAVDRAVHGGQELA